MGTTIVVAVLIIVVLLFIWLSATLISKRVEKAEGHDVCAFCGADLVQVGMEYDTHCPACGRRQPWDVDPAEA
jgi:hypothetical protein